MSRRLTKRYLLPADDYVCQLSEETQAIAAEQLRETESSRSQALASLRNWIEQNPKFMVIRMGTLPFYIKTRLLPRSGFQPELLRGDANTTL